jgi:hypothetical protein
VTLAFGMDHIPEAVTLAFSRLVNNAISAFWQYSIAAEMFFVPALKPDWAHQV